MGLLSERLRERSCAEAEEGRQLEDLNRRRAEIARNLADDFATDGTTLSPAVAIVTEGTTISFSRGDLVKNSESFNVICIAEDEFCTEYSGRKIGSFARNAARQAQPISREEMLDDVLRFLGH